MKRTISLLLAVLVAFTFAVSSFAAYDAGTFVSSPEMEYEGTIISAWLTPGEAIEILFTPFINREILSKDARTKIETAYCDIIKTDVISRVIGGYDNVYNGLVSNLGVSTLFDLSTEQGELSRDATITIGGFDLTNFVCLLHYSEDGWEIVRNATIVGLNLVFSIGNLSPFAIVVDNSASADEPASPATGDLIAAVSACGAVALGCGALFFINKSRKKVEEN